MKTLLAITVLSGLIAGQVATFVYFEAKLRATREKVSAMEAETTLLTTMTSEVTAISSRLDGLDREIAIKMSDLKDETAATTRGLSSKVEGQIESLRSDVSWSLYEVGQALDHLAYAIELSQEEYDPISVAIGAINEAFG
jgi:hypothetical protein